MPELYEAGHLVKLYWEPDPVGAPSVLEEVGNITGGDLERGSTKNTTEVTVRGRELLDDLLPHLEAAGADGGSEVGVGSARIEGGLARDRVEGCVRDPLDGAAPPRVNVRDDGVGRIEHGDASELGG